MPNDFASQQAWELHWGPSIFANPDIPETADYCIADAAELVRLEVWQFRRAVRLGLIEDCEKRWPKHLLREVLRRRWSIWREVTAFGPVGAHKCAEYLRERSGLDASVTDVHELVERFKLRPVSSYKNHHTYDPYDIDELIEEEPELIHAIVTKRIEWEESTVDIRHVEACNGLPRGSLRGMAAQLEIPCGAEWGIYPRLPLWAVDILLAEAARIDKAG